MTGVLFPAIETDEMFYRQLRQNRAKSVWPALKAGYVGKAYLVQLRGYLPDESTPAPSVTLAAANSR